MFGDDPADEISAPKAERLSGQAPRPFRTRSRTSAWRPNIPHVAAPLITWVFVAVLVLPLLAAAIVLLG
jgi:hypothetical protein